MKKYAIVSCLAGLMLVTGSCVKNDDGEYCMPDAPARKVRYELFTDKDFSGNSEMIQFNLEMLLAGREIFDSALAPMKIQDIPDSLHRIIIEKLVPAGVTDTLSVGFTYTIVDVGTSWHQELFPAGDTLKIVRFSFD
jgi:hypothetical protein